MSERSRRQYGTGSVTLRKDGLWMGRLEAGHTRSGDRRRPTVYARTEAECKRKLEAKRKQIAREGLSIATRSNASVKTWADEWIKRRVTTVAPATYTADRVAVTNWIVPVLGRRKLTALQPADIRSVAAEQRAAGRKPSTMVRTHATLMKMLKDASIEGHDVAQRLFLVEGPAGGSNDRDGIPVPQAVAILGEAARLPHGSIYATRLLQGLRPSEVRGLRWDRIDFERNVMTIDWQLKTLPYNTKYDRKSGFRVPDGYEAWHLVDAYHLVRPKTSSSWRVIPIIGWIRDALLAWKEIAPPSPHGLVWTTLDGRPISQREDDTEWDALQGAASVIAAAGDEHHVTLAEHPVGHPGGRYWVAHECRHTAATLLLEAGIDPKVITAIMGHSSIVTTRGYQHVSTEQAAAALTQISKQLQAPAPVELPPTT